MRKKYPEKKIIGNLSNQKRILEFLDLLIDNFMGAVNEKGYIEKTSTEESKAHIMRSKRSKYDLQPYIGSNLGWRLSQNMNILLFSFS